MENYEVWIDDLSLIPEPKMNSVMKADTDDESNRCTSS